MKKKKKNPLKFLRRGFDFNLSLYNRMRAAAAEKGISTKEWLADALREKLKKDNKKKEGRL